MKRVGLKRRWLVRAFGLTLLTTAFIAPPAMAEPLKVGEEAPDFLLAATTGGEVRLSEFREKKMVLIEFYHADFGPT